MHVTSNISAHSALSRSELESIVECHDNQPVLQHTLESAAGREVMIDETKRAFLLHTDDQGRWWCGGVGDSQCATDLTCSSTCRCHWPLPAERRSRVAWSPSTTRSFCRRRRSSKCLQRCLEAGAHIPVVNAVAVANALALGRLQM